MLEFIKLTKEEANDIIKRCEAGDILAITLLKEITQAQLHDIMAKNLDWKDKRLAQAWDAVYFAEFLIYMNNIVVSMEMGDIKEVPEMIESYRTNIRLLLERCEQIIEESFDYIHIIKDLSTDIILYEGENRNTAQQIYDSNHNYGNCIWIKNRKEEALI